MSKLRDDFIVQLKLSGLTDDTIKAYMYIMKGITHFFKKSPLELTKEDIQNYLYHLLEVRKLEKSTVSQIIAALKKFYKLMLPGSTIMDSFKAPRYKNKLPDVLSKAQVLKVIESTPSLPFTCSSKGVYADTLLRFSQCCSSKEMPPALQRTSS